MGVFDIVGPVMIGPSSSHTAGAARLGKMARNILGEEPVIAKITLYGSFAKTYCGHGTDKALAGGLLNFEADDSRLKKSLTIAARSGMKVSFLPCDHETSHPNTVEFYLQGLTGKETTVKGMSVGGGQIIISEIDKFQVELTGVYYTLIAIYPDKPGVIAGVTQILANSNINVAQMKVSRKSRGLDALMVLETDDEVPEQIIAQVRSISAIHTTILVSPL